MADYDWGSAWDDWGKDVAGIGATLGAGYMAYKGAGEANDTSQAGFQAASEQSMPWSGGGLFGASTFDPNTRTFIETLSPELQGQYDEYLASSKVNKGQVDALGADPVAAGKTFYDQQKALYAGDDEQERLKLENRLKAQGMFGSTGGAMQMNSFYDAQKQKDAMAQMAGYDKAQGQIDVYRGRQAADLGMVESLGLLPGQYSSLGRGIGSDQGTMATAAAQSQATAAKTMSDANAGMWTAGAKSIDNRLYGKPTK